MKVIDLVSVDWDEIIGDTISGKYEGLYLFILEQENRLTPKNGQLSIVCNTDVCLIFEASSAFREAQAVVIVNAVDEYRGRVSSRWDVWENIWMPFNELWLQNDTEMIKISLENFI